MRHSVKITGDFKKDTYHILLVKSLYEALLKVPDLLEYLVLHFDLSLVMLHRYNLQVKHICVSVQLRQYQSSMSKINKFLKQIRYFIAHLP